MKIKKAKVADDLSLKSDKKIKRKSDKEVLDMLNDKRESKYAKVKDSPYYIKYKDKEAPKNSKKKPTKKRKLKIKKAEGRMTDKDRDSYLKPKVGKRDTLIKVPAKKLILRNRGERVEEY